MYLKRLSSAVAIAAALACAPARAQDDAATPDGDTDTEELEKITVTATLTPKPVGEVSATVSVIEAADIEREVAQDIKDLIRYEPGISVRNQAGRFGLAGFNIRGLDGNRVLIQVDGARVNDTFSIGSFSNASRDTVDLDSLKQVEILRGPASSLYGSDALGGVVSFITKDPDDYLELDEAPDALLRLRTGQAGDDGSTIGGFTGAMGSGDWSGMLQFTHRQGHELENQDDAQNATRTAPNPQDYDSDAALAKLLYAPAGGHRVRLALDATRSTTLTDVLSGRTTTPLGSSTIRVDDLEGDDQQDRTRLALDWSFPEWAFVADGRVGVYTQDSNVTQETYERRTTIAASGAQTPVERFRRFDFDQDLLGVELVLRTVLGEGAIAQELVYGAEAIHTGTAQSRDGRQRNLNTGVVTNVVAPDTFPVRDFPLSETDEYALFVQDEIAFLDGRLTIVPGLRYDRFELEPEVDPVFVADNPGIVPVAIEDDNLSPKLGASLSLTDAWSLHANYAQGFRAPPYNDANIGFTNLQFGYTAIPNPDLKSEESEGIELGVRVSGDMGFATLAVYRNEYDDFIESLRSLGVDPVGGLLVFQSQNIASVTIEGAELRGALDLGTLAGAFGGFTLHTAMSYARGDDDEADRPLNSIDPPRAVAGIRYDAPDQRWNVELAATAVSDKDRVDDSFGVQFRTPGYTTFDLFGQYRFGTRARVDAGVFNLTDKFYWEWADVRGRLASDPVIARFTAPGRNVAINLVVDLP